MRDLKSQINSKKELVQINFDELKRNTEVEINSNKSEWINAFKLMKNAVFESIQNIKKDIKNLQVDKVRSTSGLYPPYIPNLSMLNQQIDLKLGTTTLARFVDVENLINTLRTPILKNQIT